MRTISAALLALTLLGCGHTLVVGQDGRIRVVVQGDRIVFDDPILFAMDSDEILHESDALLDEIAKTLQEHEEIAAVRVEGHTDATGSAEHTQELSERRAEAVVEALRERGVTQTLSAQGFGKTRPLCQEDTEACHGQNRRVELHIVR